MKLSRNIICNDKNFTSGSFNYKLHYYYKYGWLYNLSPKRICGVTGDVLIGFSSQSIVIFTFNIIIINGKIF